jgi:hypothetical protein
MLKVRVFYVLTRTSRGQMLLRFCGISGCPAIKSADLLLEHPILDKGPRMLPRFLRHLRVSRYQIYTDLLLEHPILDKGSRLRYSSEHSARRFRARPSSESLPAIGCSEPLPS